MRVHGKGPTSRISRDHHPETCHSLALYEIAQELAIAEFHSCTPLDPVVAASIPDEVRRGGPREVPHVLGAVVPRECGARARRVG